DLEQQRTIRTEEIVTAAQAVEAQLKELKSGEAADTIVFAPTGEVVVAAGAKGGKDATAALRKIVSAETERVNAELQQREKDEERAVEGKIADRVAGVDETLRGEREQLSGQAQGAKDELRKVREEIESLKSMQTLGELELRGLEERHGTGARSGRLFNAGMGAEAVREIISRMDLEELSRSLHVEVRTSSGQRRKKAIKRLRLIEAFRRSGTRPDWMILSVLPVIPPDLRPMVQLDGGRFATSDLNDLYRRVINRNNRLKRLLELGAPEIVMRQLVEKGFAHNIKSAKRIVERVRPEVWDVLEEVIKDHPVLLNRAPTLHRLGIQAFMPVLVEGSAIQIHPLVCTAFNADFDGDQMAVHVPLSPEAQIEASVLMLSSNNILSPASGQPIAVPSQDIVLGCYYLTKEKKGTKGEGRAFAGMNDVILALEHGEVETLTPVRLMYTGDLIDLTTVYDDQDVIHTEVQTVKNQIINTTVGRVILNDHLPQGVPFVNGLLRKKGLQALVQYGYLRFGLEKTVEMLDAIKDLGFRYATRAGITIGIDDLVIPEVKDKLVSGAQKEVIDVEKQYLDGAITNGERYNKVIAIWSTVTEKVADAMFKEMEKTDQEGGEFNPIYIMADSGARGSKQQIRQLAGMRGLMARPSGEIIENPITSNFREGLTVLQ